MSDTKRKVGIVLEGGSMRGMFTAGVLDTFMDKDIKIDGMIGVSAGALFGPNYFSKQRGRALRYNKRFCKDPRYMSVWSFLLTGNIVGRKFAYYDVTSKHDVFDNETFMKNAPEYYVTVSNVETGKPEYLQVKDVVAEIEKLRASSSLPFVSQIVEVDGNKYLDGGISDSIPVLKAKEMGYDKIIVVLTRPIEYRKEPFSDKMLKLMSVKYRKYPNFVEALRNRYQNYNETVEKIMELEEKGEIFVIRPSEPILVKTIERDANKLQYVYDLGVRVCHERLDALREYLEEKSTTSR